MDPILENKLRVIEDKLSDIEKTVGKIRSVQKRQVAVRSLYWIFIILLGLGAFYFVQPYFDQLKTTYEAIGGNGQQFDEFLNQFQGKEN